MQRQVPDKYVPPHGGQVSFDPDLLVEWATLNNRPSARFVQVAAPVLLWLLDCLKALDDITGDLGHPSYEDESWVRAMEVLDKDVGKAIGGWNN